MIYLKTNPQKHIMNENYPHKHAVEIVPEPSLMGPTEIVYSNGLRPVTYETLPKDAQAVFRAAHSRGDIIFRNPDGSDTRTISPSNLEAMHKHPEFVELQLAHAAGIDAKRAMVSEPYTLILHTDFDKEEPDGTKDKTKQTDALRGDLEYLRELILTLRNRIQYTRDETADAKNAVDLRLSDVTENTSLFMDPTVEQVLSHIQNKLSMLVNYDSGVISRAIADIAQDVTRILSSVQRAEQSADRLSTTIRSRKAGVLEKEDALRSAGVIVRTSLGELEHRSDETPAESEDVHTLVAEADEIIDNIQGFTRRCERMLRVSSELTDRLNEAKTKLLRIRYDLENLPTQRLTPERIGELSSLIGMISYEREQIKDTLSQLTESKDD